MACSAIEVHPFGVKKMKERNAALAGGDHQPDGELFIGRCPRHPGQTE
jgi:hypothetical protein